MVSDGRECLEFNPLSHVRLTLCPLPCPAAQGVHTLTHMHTQPCCFKHTGNSTEANHEHLPYTSLPVLSMLQLGSMAALTDVWYSTSIMEAGLLTVKPVWHWDHNAVTAEERCTFQPNLKQKTKASWQTYLGHVFPL